MKTLIKNLINKLVIIGLLAGTTTACFDDNGNYDYITLDNVVIDTAGLNILPSYAVMQFDSLTIVPNVFMNGELVNGNEENYPLEFLWEIYSATTGAGVNYAIDTVGHEIGFSDQIKRAATGGGQNTLRLSVIHKETKIKEFITFRIAISDALSDGWLVLYESTERPGTSDCGLIINDLIKKYYVGEDKVYTDLYYSANNFTPLAGKPRSIDHSCCPGIQNNSGVFYEVIVATDENLVGLGSSNFNQQLTFNDFFFEAPESCDIEAFVPFASRSEVILNNNKIHYVNFMVQSSRTNGFGIPYGGEYGKLAPFIAQRTGSSLYAVVYDSDYKCFRCVPNGSVTVQTFAPQNEDLYAFDVNNVGLEFVASDYGYNNYEYSIMKDENDNYFLLVSDFITTDVNNENISIAKYDITSSPKIEDMTTMSCNLGGELLFYGAENGVYLLKYVSQTPAEEFYKFPAGEIVTCVRTNKFFYDILHSACLNNANQILHVATYNESTGEGKVYMFPINAASGKITGTVREYTGFGKVKDMSWKYALSM